MSPRPLPAWARALEPVGIEEAAHLLGMSRRALEEALRAHGSPGEHFELPGRRKASHGDEVWVPAYAVRAKPLATDHEP